MAAYASAVTLYGRGVQRVSRDFGILAGKIDITNYNSTTTEETNITRYFKPSGQSGLEKGIISLQVVSSENGYILGFNRTTGKFKAYYRPAHSHTLFLDNADVADSAGARVNAGTNLLGANTGSDISIAGVADTSGDGGIVQAAAGALTEVANDVDLGTFDFVAFGLIPGSAR